MIQYTFKYLEQTETRAEVTIELLTNRSHSHSAGMPRQGSQLPEGFRSGLPQPCRLPGMATEGIGSMSHQSRVTSLPSAGAFRPEYRMK
jgi:hypothetical protein